MASKRYWWKFIILFGLIFISVMFFNSSNSEILFAHNESKIHLNQAVEQVDLEMIIRVNGRFNSTVEGDYTTIINENRNLASGGDLDVKGIREFDHEKYINYYEKKGYFKQPQTQRVKQRLDEVGECRLCRNAPLGKRINEIRVKGMTGAFPVSIVSQDQFVKLFRNVREGDLVKKLDFNKVNDGCYARSYLIVKGALEKKRLKLGKAFVSRGTGLLFPNGKGGYHSSVYDFHTAPWVYVRKGNKLIPMIIDPALSNSGMALNQWRRKLNANITPSEVPDSTWDFVSGPDVYGVQVDEKTGALQRVIKSTVVRLNQRALIDLDNHQTPTVSN